MSKVRLYIAAPWKDRELAKEAKKVAEAADFEVTSRWIVDHLDKPVGSEIDAAAEDSEVFAKEAKDDAKDVFNADILILLNTQPSTGKAIETGMAMAWLKPVIIVGKRTSVFHYLLPTVETLEDALKMIREWESKHSTLIVPKIIHPS